MNRTLITILLVIVLLIVIYIVYRKNFKVLAVPSVCLITGGVKTGKSLLSVKLSQKDYKKRHFIWYIRKLFGKVEEEPLYYTNCTSSFSNIHAKKPHRLDKNIVYIKKEHLLREIRFNYKSVIYINESSLLSDNMDFKNEERNALLSLFNKLICHETKGGALYYDTQSPLDNHYSQKRVCSTYFFIHKSINLFLFRVLYVREMINTENGVNNFEDDVETTTRKVLVFRWWYKHYDRYEYSYLTDDLDTSNEPYQNKKGLVSFNPLYIKLADRRNLNKNTKQKTEVK